MGALSSLAAAPSHAESVALPPINGWTWANNYTGWRLPAGPAACDAWFWYQQATYGRTYPQAHYRPGVNAISGECWGIRSGNMRLLAAVNVQSSACQAGLTVSNGVCVASLPQLSLDDPGAPNTCVGNPINPANGNKFQVERDFIAAGASPLRFERFYNSVPWVKRALMGSNWRHTYDRQLVVTTAGGVTKATIYRPQGKGVAFTQQGSNWVGLGTTVERLQSVTSPVTGWEFISADDEVELYDAAGKLLSIRSRQGVVQTMTYDTSGRLAEVTDSFGYKLVLAYNASNLVASMTNPAGKVTTYGYNFWYHLDKVTRPGTNVRSYVYDDPYLKAGQLHGIIDEKNVRFASWTYDANGRATSSQHAGGVELATISYATPNAPAVTHADNSVESYGFTLVQGSFRRASQNIPTCSNAASTTYDANGNVASRTNFNGNVTTYVYDLTRNLETSRTEASGTPRARTITTEWHPTFRLPTVITEPGRITTYSYDANGNRDGKTVTDTAANTSIAWSWTYDGFGRVLTENGPRTDVSDVTTYEYYDNTSPYNGQLKKITNALGQITEFGSYNANGQVLTMTDANGVGTAFTYDDRGLLKTRVSNGKTMTYDYDPVGQLTKVTLPDGNWVEYVYDNAHRLTEVKDKAGNKIVYTLDAMSRHIKEEVSDTQGGLSQLLDGINRSLAVNTVPQAH
jgi:YD repeat-containing protein